MNIEALIYDLERLVKINSDWNDAIVRPTLHGIDLTIYNSDGEQVNLKQIKLI